MELIEWLRAQLDADELAALACIPDNGEGRWVLDRDRAFSNPGLADNGIRMISGWAPTLPHIANWDPARVLAELKAKRAILAGYETSRRESDDYPGWEGAVYAIAQPYAGRDGWQAEWSTT